MLQDMNAAAAKMMRSMVSPNSEPAGDEAGDGDDARDVARAEVRREVREGVELRHGIPGEVGDGVDAVGNDGDLRQRAGRVGVGVEVLRRVDRDRHGASGVGAERERVAGDNRRGAAPDATIVALGLTGQESADDLRRLAEVFEVREALVAEVASQRPDRPGGLWPWTHLFDEAFDRGRLRRCEAAECPGGLRCVTLLAELAQRLHAAGWHPGMTAEDAARLLAQTGP